jgi:hypothetical protein
VQPANLQPAEVQPAVALGKASKRFPVPASGTREGSMWTGTNARWMPIPLPPRSSADLRPEHRCRPWASVLCSASAVAPRSLDGGDLPSSHDEQQLRED